MTTSRRNPPCRRTPRRRPVAPVATWQTWHPCRCQRKHVWKLKSQKKIWAMFLGDFLFTLPKTKSSPLQKLPPPPPKKKVISQTTIFQGRTVKLRGCLIHAFSFSALWNVCFCVFVSWDGKLVLGEMNLLWLLLVGGEGCEGQEWWNCWADSFGWCLADIDHLRNRLGTWKESVGRLKRTKMLQDYGKYHWK